MKDPLYILALLAIFGITVDYRLFSGIAGFPSFTIAEALSYLALVLLCGKLALEPEVLGRKLAAVYGQNKPVVWYFLWSGLASLATLTRSSDALRFYKDLIPSLIFYFLVASHVGSLRSVKGVIAAFLSGIVLNLILGISQVLSGSPRLVGLNEGASLKMNLAGEFVPGYVASGLFSHPNAFALFLVPAAILIPMLLFRVRFLGAPRKILLFAVWLLICYNLWNTYAKVAFAFILVGLALMLVLAVSRRWHLATGLAALAVSITGITVASLRAYQIRGGLFGTMLTRYELWKVALLTLRSDAFVAIFGNGFENVTSLSALYSNMQYPNAHNSYLNQIIYFGVPAFFLYVGMWCLSLKRLAGVLKTAKDWHKEAGLFLFSAIIALLGVYFYEPANQGVVAQAQFFILLALSSSLSLTESTGSGGKIEDRNLPHGIPAGF